MNSRYGWSASAVLPSTEMTTERTVGNCSRVEVICDLISATRYAIMMRKYGRGGAIGPVGPHGVQLKKVDNSAAACERRMQFDLF